MQRAVLLAMVLLCLGGCRYIEVRQNQELSIPEGCDALIVNSPIGEVTVVGGPDNASAVDISAEKFATAPTRRRAENLLEEIEVVYAVDNGTCTITVEVPDDRPRHGWGGANLTITGVRGKPMTVETGVGDIDCEDMAGGTLTTGAGSITVGTASGVVDIDTGVGAIRVVDFSGSRFTLAAGAGAASINVSGAGPLEGSIDVGTGSIFSEIAEERSCTVEMSTGVGDITLSGITDYTMTGFVSWQASFTLNEGDGDVTMKTGAGTISVRVE